MGKKRKHFSCFNSSDLHILSFFAFNFKFNVSLSVGQEKETFVEFRSVLSFSFSCQFSLSVNLYP